MSSITNTIQKALSQLTIKEQSMRKLTWDSEAVKVIKARIKHYKKTNNLRKLAIYQAKLEDKQLKIRKLKKLAEMKI